MSAHDYYKSSSQRYNAYRRPEDGPPVLPPLPYQSSQDPSSIPYASSRQHLIHDEPAPYASPFDSSPPKRPPTQETEPSYYSHPHSDLSSSIDGGLSSGNRFFKSSKRQYSDEIPLRDKPSPYEAEPKPASPDQLTEEPGELLEPVRSTRRTKRRDPSPEPPRRFWSRGNTWVVYFFTLVQVTVFIAELVRNAVLTTSPIEIHPQINPMLGPSFPVLVNMGARYVPCMKNVPDLAPNLNLPCPNTTISYATDTSNQCSINELCGFANFGNSPNQWWRFIAPMFMHAGIIHIGFNMLLQLTLGREIEQIIGPVRFAFVYIASGIFGFVLGGNFAAPGIASTGASGALFGLIAINLLDLLYTWHERRSPKKELAFIMLDIIISFALGLLPGLDNFSHIGGFLMGLVLGICILHSPNRLRLDRTQTQDATGRLKRKRDRRVSYKTFTKDPGAFFRGRKALWWVWWFIRAGALLGVLIAFIVLLNTFYLNHNTCTWCRYLSCIVSILLFHPQKRAKQFAERQQLVRHGSVTYGWQHWQHEQWQ